MDIRYIVSAAKAEQLPAPDAPEVGLIGRSNVGKSSLINAMSGRRNLARTSRTPGRTQMANYFTVADKWWLVDLPGYGFSQLSPSQRRHWQALMDGFLLRPSIASIVFLKDIRRDWDEDDLSLLRWISDRHCAFVAITKADKIRRGDHKIISNKTLTLLNKEGIEVRKVIVTSATKKINTAELWSEIASSTQSKHSGR